MLKKIFIIIAILLNALGTAKAQTLAEPKDVTEKINNPNFTTTGNNWGGTPAVDGIATNRCAEMYNTTFDVYQNLSGLEDGWYSVSVQGFYRAGVAGSTETTKNAYLYADNNGDEDGGIYSVPLMSINEGTQKTALYTVNGDTWNSDRNVGGIYVPNSMNGASTYFSNGLYGANTVWVKVTEGTLRIGIKKDVAVNKDWTCFDSFKLHYYGNPDENTTWYLQNVATGQYLQGGMDYGTKAVLGNGIEFTLERTDDGLYNISTGIVYQSHDYLCSEASLDHTATDFRLHYLGNGKYNIATTTEHCSNNTMETGTAGKLLIAKSRTYSSKSLYGVTFEASTEQADTYAQWRLVTEEERIAELAKASAGKPIDATFLIKGASFTYGDDRKSKWNGSSFNTARAQWKEGAAGIVDKSGEADVYQEIKNLPNGVYEVTVQACHRNFTDAVLYANDATVALGTAGSEITDIASASTATHYTDSYKKRLLVTVTDGKLRIGVKTGDPSDTDDNLLIFDNFTLRYLGTSTSGTYYLRNVATKEFVRAGKAYEAQAIRSKYGLDLIFNYKAENVYSIDTRISNGGTNQYLTPEAFVDGSEINMEVVPAGNGYYNIKYSDKLLFVDTNVTTVYFSNSIDASSQYAQWELLTRDDLIAELKSSGASDANPKDATFFIQAPNFGRHDLRTNTDNWKGVTLTEGEKGSEYGGVESSTHDWSKADINANKCIEKFSKTFDTYQTITGLPAGVYELSVQAFYRSGRIEEMVNKTNNGTDLLRPFIYAKQGDKLIGQTPIMSIIDQAQASKIGDSGFSTAANGKYIPNSFADAAMAYRDGYYAATSDYNKVRFVVTGDNATIQIGIKKNVLYTNDWTTFDNFELTYLGAADDETQTVYENEIGTALGTFYLKNAYTKTYLTAGGTDGVSATMGDMMYQRSVYDEVEKYKEGVRETDFKFTLVRDNRYVIETGFNGGYLTLQGKLNGTPALHVVEKVTGNGIGDNEYGVYDPTPKADGKIRYLKSAGYGTASNDPSTNAHLRWIFQTKDDLLSEFASASEENPVDATFLLKGTSFHKDDTRNAAWTGVQSIGGEGGPDGTIHPNYVGEVNERSKFNVYQKITGIPNGVYEYTLQGCFKTMKGGSHYVDNNTYYYTSTDNINFVGGHRIISAYYTTTKPNNKYEASLLFESEESLTQHNPIRFKVENGTIIIGVYRTNNATHPTLFIDNVRLTYLGESATGYETPKSIARGIKHKPSRFYDLAEEDGNMTLDRNTYKATMNKTTMSNDAMVKHEYTSAMMQNAPVYTEYIYLAPSQVAGVVMPSAYTGKNRSSSKYYQRFYNYKTDDVFVEDAATTGTIAYKNDATVRAGMETYEGSATASAGGVLFGERWNNQMIAEFWYTAPSTFNDTIMLGIDHSDYTDVGDMDMFGDLTEPTLTQRIVYKFIPSSKMVDNLASCTGDVYYEDKSISFPTIWHGLNTGKDLNAVALDMQLKNYFTDASKVPSKADFTITLDDGGTGITLNTTAFGGNGERFIRFNYPSGGVVTNNQNPAIITVTSNGKNIARFKLNFVANTELRPWKDIMGKSTMRRSPAYLEEHAIAISQLNFDNRYSNITSERSTWPVGDESGINGVESNAILRSWDQFNPYPLDFSQTSFAANYHDALWGQYSVTKSIAIPSYKSVKAFKDVNQLYYDFYKNAGNATQQAKYPGSGYFMYIDASDFPSSVAQLELDEELCAGTTIHFSAWLSAMDLSTHDKNYPGYLLFSIVGKTSDGKQEVIESFCPGPIRADAMSYDGKVTPDTYNNELWGTESNFIWQQFAFSFVIEAEAASKFKSYALKIDNYCSSTSGGDMMVDDVRLYIQRAVPDVLQSTPVCNTGQINGMKVYTTFEQLMNAVDMTETNSESDARNGYAKTSSGNANIPAAWYCFLDKDVYDQYISNKQGAAAAFAAALVKSGGNTGTGYYKFDFSTCFASNDGGNATQNNINSIIYANTAKGETILNPDGTTAERRIYLTPPLQGLLSAGEVSLKEMAYFYKDGEKWITSKPEWRMNNSSDAIIYGHNDGDPIRYADIEGYDELRIYQTDVDAKGAVRCFFIKTDGTAVTVTAGTEVALISENGYLKLDLATVKEKYGQLKLIGIKAASASTTANVDKITLYKKSGLEADKDYYILFRAVKGSSGEPAISNPKDFFMLDNSACASMAEFRLKAGSVVRFDGILNYEGGNRYCEGQVATMKVEMQGLDQNNMPIQKEDLFYDWWIGTEEEFNAIESGKPDSPKDVLFVFRKEYPEAKAYNNEAAKGEFTEAYREYLIEMISPQGTKAARLYLYQATLNARVESGSDNQMTVIVVPIESQLKELSGMEFCNEPMNLTIKVEGKSPTVSDGFEGSAYPAYMRDLPLRIGLKQTESITDDADNQWNAEDNALYIPLRDLASSENTYITFQKKKWDDDTTLDIAAVYLAETNDPEMVSYTENNGNMEMRFVGKVHKFDAQIGRGTFEDYIQLTLNPTFIPKEGYRYVLKTQFIEIDKNGTSNICYGDLLIPLYIVPEYQVWTGGAGNNDWANNDNWRRADNSEIDNEGNVYASAGRPSNEDNTTSNGLVPMKFTNVVMPTSDGTVYASLNKVATDANGIVDFGSNTTQTKDIQYYLDASNEKPNMGWVPERNSDLYCVPFCNNTCNEINFAPQSQIVNSHYLNYSKAWVEYSIESGRWYTLSSPLKGVVSGDMYLPRGSAKQTSPYFTGITYNNNDYSRLQPAVYQQAWDKASATTYRLERNQLADKLPPALEASTATVNVARAFDWSREYNDVKVPFGMGGFSVRVDVSEIDGYSKTDGERDVLMRLPKDDKTYLYYAYDDATGGSQTVDLTTTEVNGKMLREGAGKLFTDDMKANDEMQVTITNNSTGNPYFMVGNPFMSGLDIDRFLSVNSGLDWTYWILTKDSYYTGIKNESSNWLYTNGTGNGDIAPLQAFFVRKSDDQGGSITVKFTKDMMVPVSGSTLLTRGSSDEETAQAPLMPMLRIRAERDGVESMAVLACSEKASDGYNRKEDAEALFDSNLEDAHVLYTMAGEMAAAINVRRTLNGVPLGVQGNDAADVTLTFEGAENFEDDLYLYDLAEDKATPINSFSTSISISGNSNGRYYIVASDISGSKNAEPIVSVEGGTVNVISMGNSIMAVSAADMGGRNVYHNSVQGNSCSFKLPKGVYIICVKTENAQTTSKIIVR